MINSPHTTTNQHSTDAIESTEEVELNGAAGRTFNGQVTYNTANAVGPFFSTTYWEAVAFPKAQVGYAPYSGTPPPYHSLASFANTNGVDTLVSFANVANSSQTYVYTQVIGG